jgi:hypothetical protein
VKLLEQIFESNGLSSRTDTQQPEWVFLVAVICAP